MFICHEKIDPTVSVENTFVARDDSEQIVGVCTVSPRHMTLFPDCPEQYVVCAMGDDRALHVLYGAAVARARVLAEEKGLPARIYAEVEPEDEASLEVLHALGFEDGDCVLRMYRDVTTEPNDCLLPAGCTIVRDFLADPMERRFFLERYNAYYGLKNDDQWLEEIVTQKDFARIVMISPEGLCGELLVWSEEGVGVIGIVQTASKWRRCGVASYLIEDARQYFASINLTVSQFDAWLSAPGAVALAEKCGYKEEEMVVCYPDMYI